MLELGFRRRASCLAVFLALAACEPSSQDDGSPPPATTPAADEKLDILIPSLVDAIQAKQPEFVMTHVATDFKEDRGLDYYGVRALVEKFALGDDPVGARLESVEVTPEADVRQRARTRVAFAAGKRLAPGESLPEGSVVYGIEVLFEKREGRWQAVGGRYARESPPATSPPTPPTSTR